MAQLNLLFLIPNRAFGGLEIQTVKRASDAMQKGYQVLLVAKENTRVEQYAKELDLNVITLDFRYRYIDKGAITLGRIMKKQRIDFCVVPKTDYLSYAILGRNIFSNKTRIIFYQQLESAFPKKDIFHNWIYRNVDSVITLTNVMKHDLPKYTSIDGNKIEVIPYGIDTELYNPKNFSKQECREKFSLPEGKILFGLPGRITDSKGQDVAMRAFAKANIPDSCLVFCGDGSSSNYFTELMGIADSMGIREKIIQLPFTKEMHLFMNAMDISLLPSKREAFGLVVIEAMASGMPILATNAGGVPEIISHTNNGLLFEPFDDDALAKYMVLLANDIGLREKLGKQARLDAIERYDYSKQTKKFFDYLIGINKKN